MNNYKIQSGGIAEARKNWSFFSNALWGKEFEKFTKELQTKSSLDNDKRLSIVLENKKMLNILKKFTKDYDDEKRITEISYDYIHINYATTSSGLSSNMPLSIDAKTRKYQYTTGNVDDKLTIQKNLKTVYALFNDIMKPIPSGRETLTRLNTLLDKINQYLTVPFEGNNEILSIVKGDMEIKYVESGTGDLLEPSDDHSFEIWTQDNKFFSIGDVLFYVVSYLEFYKFFPKSRNNDPFYGNSPNGQQINIHWKQLKDANGYDNSKPDVKRFQLFINYYKIKKALITKDRKDKLKAAMELVPAEQSIIPLGEDINKTIEQLPMWIMSLKNVYFTPASQIVNNALALFLKGNYDTRYWKNALGLPAGGTEEPNIGEKVSTSTKTDDQSNIGEKVSTSTKTDDPPTIQCYDGYNEKIQKFFTQNPNSWMPKLRDGSSKKRIVWPQRGPAPDWNPPLAGEPSEYAICINPDGSITHGGNPINGKKTYSFIVTRNGLIFGFNNDQRNKTYCSEEMLEKRKEYGEKISDSVKTQNIGKECGNGVIISCCVYHGKLTQMLINKGFVNPKYGIVSAGELKIGANGIISSINNQSGHFMPPKESNDNAITAISIHLNIPITITTKHWNTQLGRLAGSDIKISPALPVLPAEAKGDEPDGKRSDEAEYNFDNFNNNVISKGFLHVDIADNGDCMFEAMLKFLQKNPNVWSSTGDEQSIRNSLSLFSQYDIRKLIVNFIVDNWDDYKIEIQSRDGCNGEEKNTNPTEIKQGEKFNNWCKTPENYKNIMLVKKDGDNNWPQWYVPEARWGSQSEMLAFGQLKNIGINLWTKNGEDIDGPREIVQPTDKPSINLLFHPGSGGRGGHYTLLVPIPTTAESKTAATTSDVISTPTSIPIPTPTPTPKPKSNDFFDSYLMWLDTNDIQSVAWNLPKESSGSSKIQNPGQVV